MRSSEVQIKKDLTPVDQLGIRGEIQKFEEKLSSVPGVFYGDNESCPLRHSFCGNVYIREIFIPKGTVVVGKIHRHEHPNFLLKGEVIVVTETGGIERIKAPMSMISKPATKRIVFASEDVVWVTIHEVGEERDLEKIEEIVIAKSYDDLAIGHEEKLKIKSDEENVSVIKEIIKGDL